MKTSDISQIHWVSPKNERQSYSMLMVTPMTPSTNIATCIGGHDTEAQPFIIMADVSGSHLTNMQRATQPNEN